VVNLVAWRLRQGAAGVRLSGAAGAAGAAKRRPASRTRISSTSCSSRIPTTRCCVFPITASSIGSRCISCRRPAEVSRGKPIVNLLPASSGRAASAPCWHQGSRGGQVRLMATSLGTVKKTSLALFSRPRTSGINRVALDEGDKRGGAVAITERHEGHLAVHDGREGDPVPRGRSTTHGPRGRRRCAASKLSDDQR